MGRSIQLFVQLIFRRSKNMKKEVYGRIDMTGSFILPLEEAHKIQLILAKHGELMGSIWRSNEKGGAVAYLLNCTQPAVEVVDLPAISAKELDYRQLSDWREMVGNSEGSDFLSPKDFVKLSEESK